jgi:hypothetical protein
VRGPVGDDEAPVVGIGAPLAGRVDAALAAMDLCSFRSPGDPERPALPFEDAQSRPTTELDNRRMIVRATAPGYLRFRRAKTNLLTSRPSSLPAAGGCELCGRPILFRRVVTVSRPVGGILSVPLPR